MAKVKIQGHASGTGILTVTAPNTSTDRTITLPDATGTLSITPSITDGGNATAVTIDSSENVGIGTSSPASSHAGGSTLQIGPNASGEMPIIIQHIVTDHAGVMGNAHYDGTWKYKESEQAYSMRFHGQGAGTQGIVFSCAAAGTAGNTITNWDGTDVKMVITPDGRGLSQFTAKAWCAWNQTGTPAIRDSHNCSSITDYGTGEGKATLTNNMATADSYAVSCIASKASGAPSGTNSTFTTIGESLPVTGPVVGFIYNGSASDRPYVSVIIFGD